MPVSASLSTPVLELWAPLIAKTLAIGRKLERLIGLGLGIRGRHLVLRFFTILVSVIVHLFTVIDILFINLLYVLHKKLFPLQAWYVRGCGTAGKVVDIQNWGTQTSAAPLGISIKQVHGNTDTCQKYTMLG